MYTVYVWVCLFIYCYIITDNNSKIGIFLSLVICYCFYHKSITKLKIPKRSIPCYQTIRGFDWALLVHAVKQWDGSGINFIFCKNSRHKALLKDCQLAQPNYSRPRQKGAPGFNYKD